MPVRSRFLPFDLCRRMYDDQGFSSWPAILAGAMLFSSLFVLLGLMIELLFEGAFQVTSTVVGFGVAAFVGYVGAMLILRHIDSPNGS